jgi:hypothetical protein
MKSFLTDKKLLKSGGRKASIISPEELEEKICKLGKSYGTKETEYNSLLYSSVFQILCEDRQIQNDLSKITFDFENLDVEDEAYENTGFHTLDNGFSFLFGMASGDWECAIGFIIYWDGKKLRGYIPTLGNTFNLKKKCAFGSEDDGDDIVDCFSNFVYEITGRPATSQELDLINCGEYYVNFELFKEDILSRIEIDAEEVEKYKKSLEKKEEKISNSHDSSGFEKISDFKTGDTIYVAGSLEECEAFPCIFLTQIGSSALVLTSFFGDGSLEESLMGCMEFIDTECPSGIFAVPVENCFATEEESVEAFENGEYITY